MPAPWSVIVQFPPNTVSTSATDIRQRVGGTYGNAAAVVLVDGVVDINVWIDDDVDAAMVGELDCGDDASTVVDELDCSEAEVEVEG